MSLAIAVRTRNAKLGERAYATSASQHSCPSTCPWLHNGCYAEYGPQGIHTRRLSIHNASPIDIAHAEAEAIDALPTDPKASMLRVHVVGDCTTPEAARRVSHAAFRWTKRTGAPAFTYTHAWRTVPRHAWFGVSCLASVESVADARKARRRGYVPALLVPQHQSKRAWMAHGMRMIPCPNQTTGVTCAQCKLCLFDEALRARNAAIVFESHGAGASRVDATLTKGDPA